MKLDQRVVFIGISLVVAIGAGYFVQNAEFFMREDQKAAALQSAQAVRLAHVADAPVRFDFDQVTPLAAPSSEAMSTVELAKILLPQDPAANPSLPAAPLLTKPLIDRMLQLDDGQRSLPQVGGDLNRYGMSCASGLTVEPATGAMAHLHVMANCHADERVEVTHDRLVFTARLSSIGTLDLDIPALVEQGDYTVQLANGTFLRASAEVQGASSYERVALQWNGAPGPGLHAYEFGAGYGDKGHVSADTPRNPGHGEAGRGGFMTVLGSADVDAPLVAQVYSFPRALKGSDETVRLSIEIEVTEQNCGKEVSARTIRAPGEVTALELTMPGCEAVGQFLVLKNAVRDMKLARN